MLKVMNIAGIRKKRVKVQHVPARGEERGDEFDAKVLALDTKMEEIMKQEGHILYLDECVFKAKDFARTAYSNPKQSLKVLDRTYN